MRSICAAVLLIIAGVAATHALELAGIVESATSLDVRPRLSAAEIAAFLPSRGEFRFPAPYSTVGVRVTNADDCQGHDCVLPVGYSYWSNINNHAGRDEMLIVLGLDRSRGGGGPTLFSYNKSTGETRNRGPLFDAGSPYSWSSGEGWYFSASRPDALYMTHGARILRHDVSSHATEVVADVRVDFGADKYIWQAHSSADDRVHSATLRQMDTWEMLGCVVYGAGGGTPRFFPKQGAFDECQIDKSGRWLVIKENVDGRHGEDNRIIDLSSGAEQVLLDEEGAAGHSDLGFGVMVAEDNFNSRPGAVLRWDLTNDIHGTGQGRLVYRLTSWATGLGHIALGAQDDSVACASNASRLDLPRVNEIVCFPLDGSLNAHVVAPNLTDLNAAGGGGDDYAKLPKGNLDPTGEYFIWTANAGTNRLDAFVVRIAGARPEPEPLPAPFDKIAPASGSGDVDGNVGLSWGSSAGAAGYEYCVDTTDNNTCDAPWTSAGTSTSAMASALTRGTTFYWQVRATNASGTETANVGVWWRFSTPAPIVEPPPPPPPPPPPLPPPPTPVPNPAMAVDTPFMGATVQTSFSISGWAIDRGAASGTGVDALHVWAFPRGSGAGIFVGMPAYGSGRTDIASALGGQFAGSGFSMSATLPPGEYDLLVYMHSTVTGTFNRVIGHTITVAPPTLPATFMDQPLNQSTRSRAVPLTISGWAIDRGAAAGTGVTDIHVWAFPAGGFGPGRFVGVATYGTPRADVAAAFGSARFAASGYTLTVPAHTLPAGTYLLVAFGNSTVTGAFTQSVGATVTFTP
jgi:hypothetical protein